MFDVLEIFGLQVMLEDRTSTVADEVTKSLQKMGVAVDDIEKQVYGSFMRMESIMHSGFQIRLWGQRVFDVGRTISGVMSQITQSVIKTGNEFEIQRIKLRSLYRDAQLGEEVFQYAVRGALITPFDVSDYVAAVAGLKVSQIDPLKQYLNERTGEMQDMVMYAGDLAAAFGRNMFDAYFSLKEVIAGNDWRSLRHRFDGLSKGVIESVTGMTMSTEQNMAGIEQRAEVMAKFIGMQYGGMMIELGKSWGGLLNRLKENLDVFLMWIGDMGLFPLVKKELETIIIYVESRQEKLKAFAKVVSDSISSIIAPIATAIRWGVRLVDKLVDIGSTHPQLFKVATTATILTGSLTALLGIVTILSGSFVTMVASLATLALNIRMSHGSTKMSAMIYQGFGKVIFSLIKHFARFTIVSAIFTTAWKNNAGGIRDSFHSMTSTVRGAYDVFDSLVKLDIGTFTRRVGDLKKVDSAITRLGLTFAKGYYVIKGFFDYLDDGLVLTDTVLRLDELGALGFLESFIKAEIAIRSITEGIVESLTAIWREVKPVVTFIYRAFETLLNIWDRVLNRGGRRGTIIDDIEMEFTGKESFSKFQSIGQMIGAAISAGIVFKVGSAMIGIIAGARRLNQMFLKSYVASRGLPLDEGGRMLTTLPWFMSRSRKFGQNEGEYRKTSWGNVALNKIGRAETTVAKNLYGYDENMQRNQRSKVSTLMDGLFISSLFGRRGRNNQPVETSTRPRQQRYDTGVMDAYRRGRETTLPTERILTGRPSPVQQMGREQTRTRSMLSRAGRTVMDGLVFTQLMGTTLFKKMRGETLGWGKRGTRPSEKQVWDRSFGRLILAFQAGWSGVIKVLKNPLLLMEPFKWMTKGITRVMSATGGFGRRLVGGVSDTASRVVGAAMGALMGNRMGRALVSVLSFMLRPVMWVAGLAVANPITTALVLGGTLLYGVLNNNKFAQNVYDKLITWTAKFAAWVTVFFTDVLPKVFIVGSKLLGLGVRYGIDSFLKGTAKAEEAFSKGYAKLAPEIEGILNASGEWMKSLLPKDMNMGNLTEPLKKFPDIFDDERKKLVEAIGLRDAETLQTMEGMFAPFSNSWDRIAQRQEEIIANREKIDNKFLRLVGELAQVPARALQDTLEPFRVMDEYYRRFVNQYIPGLSPNQTTTKSNSTPNLPSPIIYDTGRSYQRQQENKHSFGLPYVPYDNYPAILHRGEEVLSAVSANKRRRDMNSKDVYAPQVSNVYNMQNYITNSRSESRYIEETDRGEEALRAIRTLNQATSRTTSITRSMDNRTANVQETHEHNYSIDEININLPNVRDVDSDTLEKAFKDPSVIRSLTQALAKAKREDDMRTRKQIEFKWGVNSV